MPQLRELIFNSATHICFDFDGGSSSSTPPHALNSAGGTFTVGVPKMKSRGRLVLATWLVKGGSRGGLLSSVHALLIPRGTVKQQQQQQLQ